MKTLYVSDLDGTLLRSDIRTSDYTNRTINRLVAQGMLFSYATARSYITSTKVTRGLNAAIPLIVYNGAMVINNVSGQILLSNFFTPEIRSLLHDLINHDIYPLIYSFQEGAEKFTYIREKCSRGMCNFIDSRKGDPRDHPVSTISELLEGDLFYISCIDDEDKLTPFYAKYKDQYHCIFHRDVYSNDPWLEIMPLAASKSNAIRQLKEFLHCDGLVVFGDGKNDMDMFEMADECYAVENAVDELKKIATQVIGKNDDDSVAKWLEKNYTFR